MNIEDLKDCKIIGVTGTNGAFDCYNLIVLRPNGQPIVLEIDHYNIRPPTRQEEGLFSYPPTF